MKQNQSYLVGAAISKATAKKNIFLCIGGILAIFFGFGFIASFTDENIANTHGRLISVVFLIPAFLLLWKGIQAGRDIGLARRYQGIFAADVNGVVQLEELTAQTGKRPDVIARELEGLFRRGFFHGCSLQASPLAVLLSGTAQATVFVNVVCPHCGGTTRIRSGSRGKCEYCGGGIQG